jgi:hypothetical protein
VAQALFSSNSLSYDFIVKLLIYGVDTEDLL